VTSALILPVHAGVTECRVADPTGTPLNVRTIPGGRKIVETLKNGTQVTILDSKNDWAYIGLVSEKDHLIPTGWVYRKYLDCTTPKTMSDPDDWLIVKDLASSTCVVSATKPNATSSVIVTSFKAFVMGGEAMKNMVVAECGCEKQACDFELPRE
jgi:hypothetical protein